MRILAAGVIIGLLETAMMLLLKLAKWFQWDLPYWLGVTVDAEIVSVSAVLLFWAGIQHVNRQLLEEKHRSGSQERLNADLKRALDEHALVSICDVQGRITFANDKFCKVSGYSEAELLGQDHRIINSGYHDKGYFQAMWNTIRQGHTWQGEILNRSRGGRLYWVDTTIIPFLDERGKPYQYVALRRDITESKASEHERLRLRMAAEASADMIVLTDAKGVIEYVNPAFCRFTGWNSAEVLGHTPKMLGSGRIPAPVFEQMWGALLRGEPWRGRLLNRRKEGPVTGGEQRLWRQCLPCRRNGSPLSAPGNLINPQLYWAEISITPIRGETGTNLGFVSIQRDISETVAQEERQALIRLDADVHLAIADILNQSAPLKERFTNVLERLLTLPDLASQRKGGILLRQHLAEPPQLFVHSGQFGEDFPSRKRRLPTEVCLCLGSALPPADAPMPPGHHCEPCYQSDYGDEDVSGHFLVPLISGEDIHGVMFLSTDLNLCHAIERVAMLKQIGESMGLAIAREQARKLVEQARDAALDISREKSEFLANMGHELRTPMNGILGMLELLQDSPLSTEQQEFASVAAHSAKALLAVINSILDFSKIETGKLELESVDFNVADLVKEICSLLEVSAAAKGINLQCLIQPGLAADVRGDPARLRLVMTHLIGNAIKFTQKGQVCVDLACLPLEGHRVQLRFMVKDTGIGIAQGDSRRLFEPFRQADGATTRRYGGTGLGLSIAKSLVEHMGGDGIHINSQPGAGSTFWFAVELETQEQAPKTSAKIEPRKPSQPLSLPGKKVLLVEDNPVNQRVAMKMLETLQVQIHTVVNGREALDELASHHNYDMVLMDCQMPEMDGYTATAAWREAERNLGLTRTPVIALTASTTEADLQQCLAAGMDDYLVKPFSLDGLAQKLLRWLPANAPFQDELAWDAEEALARLGGDRNLLAAMKPLLVDKAPSHIRQLKSGQVEQIGEAARALKAIAGQFCAWKVVGLAAQVEQLACADGAGAPVSPLTEQLIAAVDELLEAM
jgi:PAS domain S-box-containing protein